MIHPAGTVHGDTEVWSLCHITTVPVRRIEVADKFLMISSVFSSAGKDPANRWKSLLLSVKHFISTASTLSPDLDDV